MAAISSLLSSVGISDAVSLEQDSDILFANADRQSLHQSEPGEPQPYTRYEYYKADQPLGYVSFYASGNLWCVHPYRNGFKQEFSQCGELLRHQELRDGKVAGVTLVWHKNGTLAYATQSDAEHPTTAYWNESGALTRLQRMFKPNKTAFVCLACRHNNFWKYDGNAGWSDRGFLYNEDGNFVFSWSSYDPIYLSIVGEGVYPWCLSQDQKKSFQSRIRPAPSGGRFLFSNPGRCEACQGIIAFPLPETFYLYDRSKMIETGSDCTDGPLSNYLI